MMTLRENYLAALSFKPYEKLPVVRFEHWPQTIEKWRREGYLTAEEPQNDFQLAVKQGFDFPVWHNAFGGANALSPSFEPRIIEELPDGSIKRLGADGVVILEMKDCYSIPKEIDHLLVDRRSFEEHFRFRLQYSDSRIDFKRLDLAIKNRNPEYPSQFFLGSFFGCIRNWTGVEGFSYLLADDEALFDEIVAMVGDVIFRMAQRIFEYGYRPDICLIWEDICFKNGPLVNPKMFAEKVGPQYKRVCDLVRRYGVDIIGLDCDGMIDALLPIWLENGVNTMFPIEIGTWNGNIKTWREKYGQAVRGIGGMNKLVLERDYAAIDAEIERIRPLVELGGYVPCLDHNITPGATWDNVRHYCDRMHKVFG